MCGRYNIIAEPLMVFLADITQMTWQLETRYNIAPTTDVPVVVQDPEGLELMPMRWWLIPSWTKEPSHQYSMFNARSETLHKSPAFRGLIKQKRCIIPASGYYEWQQQADKKQPFHIQADAPDNNSGLLMAGLWDCWQNHETMIYSCTIITKPASVEIKHIHHRMPVLLNAREPTVQHEQVMTWLNPKSPAQPIKQLITQAVNIPLRYTPVSSFVSNSRHQGEQCIAAIGESSSTSENQ